MNQPEVRGVMGEELGASIMKESCRRERHKLPNLLIIGAMKCATTSLHYYLGLHPDISMSREKELNFFICEGNWHKGLEWYKSHFTGEAKIHGESSPNYTNYPFSRGVPERVYSCVPEAKLIYIARDPIDRIISHYIHQYAVRRENRTLSEVLANPRENPYLFRSKYFMQLEQYLEYFPQCNVLVITQEDLYSHRRETLQKIFRFLDVDDSFHCQEFSTIRHRSSAKRRKNQIGLSLHRTLNGNIFERFPPNTRWLFEQLLYLPFSNKIERPVLNEGLTQRLLDYLASDIDRISRDCPHVCRNFADLHRLRPISGK